MVKKLDSYEMYRVLSKQTKPFELNYYSANHIWVWKIKQQNSLKLEHSLNNKIQHINENKN